MRPPRRRPLGSNCAHVTAGSTSHRLGPCPLRSRNWSRGLGPGRAVRQPASVSPRRPDCRPQGSTRDVTARVSVNRERDRAMSVTATRRLRRRRGIRGIKAGGVLTCGGGTGRRPGGPRRGRVTANLAAPRRSREPGHLANHPWPGRRRDPYVGNAMPTGEQGRRPLGSSAPGRRSASAPRPKRSWSARPA